MPENAGSFCCIFFKKPEGQLHLQLESSLPGKKIKTAKKSSNTH
jgi:hypothetical protein